jgi:hypothetical protein
LPIGVECRRLQRDDNDANAQARRHALVVDLAIGLG